MTTGSFNVGQSDVVGIWVRKSWSGANRDKSEFRPRVKWRDLPPITDPWGHVLTPRDGVAYEMARIAAKARMLRQQKAAALAAPQPVDGLHAYNKSHMKANNSLVFRNGVPFGAFQNALGDFTVTDPWTANDDLKLIDKLRQRIQGSGVDFGTALAEIDKAMRMVASDFRVMYLAISALRKGDYKRALELLWSGENASKHRESDLAKHLLSKTANRQLVWEYGYKPLISDVDEAMQFTAWALNTQPAVRMDALRRIVAPIVIDSGIPPDPAFSFGFRSARVVAYLRSVDQVALSGIHDFPSIMWERLKWSFILDWAIPIQSYLRARNALQSLDGNYVITRKLYGQWKPAADQWQIAGSTYSNLQAYWCSRFWINRDIVWNLSAPFPTVKPLAKILSAQHALNACSLFVQQLQRKLPFL